MHSSGEFSTLFSVVLCLKLVTEVSVVFVFYRILGTQNLLTWTRNLGSVSSSLLLNFMEVEIIIMCSLLLFQIPVLFLHWFML